MVWPNEELQHGDFDIEIVYSGAATLSRRVIVNEALDGMPVVFYGSAKNIYYELNEQEWAGFDVPEGTCVHKLDVLDKVVKFLSEDGSKAYFRSLVGGTMTNIMNVPAGKTGNLRWCSTKGDRP